MNPFDAAVYLCLLVAIIAGFNSGLLRSLATICGYLCAMPLAVLVSPRVTQILNDQFHVPELQSWVVLFAIFLVTGIAVSALLRMSVGEIVGARVSLPDRLAGAVLGAVRIGLLAVLMVLIFERIIPFDRQPRFLAESRLRPFLSLAAQKGLKSLPPDVTAYIDRLKRERGL